MQSSPPRVLLRLSMLALALPAVALSACAHQPVAFLNAGNCSELIPKGWWCAEGQVSTPEKPCGIPSADLPTDDSAGQWVAFGDAQTGQVDKANGRGSDTVAIYQKCEAWQRKAAEQLRPKTLLDRIAFWRPKPDG